jgi:primosomal protein N' (replication factor Y)
MPENPSISAAAKYDYAGFYQTELTLRNTLQYPPFTDILQIVTTSEDEEIAKTGAAALANDIEKSIPREGFVLFGPYPAPVAQVSGNFRYMIHIKAPPALRTTFEKILSGMKSEINTDKTLKYRIMIEVNPFSFM